MKFLPLFWANLRRKPVRTGLTFASIVVAFLLYGLLSVLQAALTFGVELAGVDRLITMHRMSLIQPLPRNYLERIRAVEGVRAATSSMWFGGIYQDDRNQIAAMSADPRDFLAVYEEYAMPPEQREVWLADRTSIMVGKAVAARFGWQVGDTVPLRSAFYRKTDGSQVWDFKVAAIFEAANGDNSSVYFHYDYLNETLTAPRDMIGWVILRVDDPARTAEISREIDALFANSPAETKTSTERAFAQGFANQIGNIGAIVAVVATAVFFTMLLVTGNTMAQSVRERIAEIAVLKTLGFSGRGVAMLVFAEAFAITAAGGIVGLALATTAAGAMSGALAQFFPFIGVPASAYTTGGLLIVALSALAALLPSLRAERLEITEALRRA